MVDKHGGFTPHAQLDASIYTLEEQLGRHVAQTAFNN
jgi:hypothetical protein